MKKFTALFAAMALLLYSTAAFAEDIGTPSDLAPVVTTEPTATVTAVPSEEATEAPTVTPTAEPSAEPTAAPTEAPTAEPTEAPTAEPAEVPTEAPTAAPERSIKVTLKHDGDVIYYGDKVTLVAELGGYDDVPVTLQWLLNGEPVEGAVTLEYTFIVTPETVGAWQLAVTTPD